MKEASHALCDIFGINRFDGGPFAGRCDLQETGGGLARPNALVDALSSSGPGCGFIHHNQIEIAGIQLRDQASFFHVRGFE
jgi:hypothetical protein